MDIIVGGFYDPKQNFENSDFDPKYKIISWFKFDYSFEPKIHSEDLNLDDATIMLQAICIKEFGFHDDENMFSDTIDEWIKFADGTFGLIGKERVYSIVKQIN